MDWPCPPSWPSALANSTSVVSCGPVFTATPGGATELAVGAEFAADEPDVGWVPAVPQPARIAMAAAVPAAHHVLVRMIFCPLTYSSLFLSPPPSPLAPLTPRAVRPPEPGPVNCR